MPRCYSNPETPEEEKRRTRRSVAQGRLKTQLPEHKNIIEQLFEVETDQMSDPVVDVPCVWKFYTTVNAL